MENQPLDQPRFIDLDGQRVLCTPFRDAVKEGLVINGKVIVLNTDPPKVKERLIPIWEREDATVDQG